MMCCVVMVVEVQCICVGLVVLVQCICVGLVVLVQCTFLYLYLLQSCAMVSGCHAIYQGPLHVEAVFSVCY
jgi:hypothetical protein